MLQRVLAAGGGACNASLPNCPVLKIIFSVPDKTGMLGLGLGLVLRGLINIPDEKL